MVVMSSDVTTCYHFVIGSWFQDAADISDLDITRSAAGQSQSVSYHVQFFFSFFN
jgi:hypothetical protein